ncbi:MAG: ABC transporter [candidate division Zixibacteria bacterium 4484_95]|nr:MAG: ABC transporter [candidate division Zixibacteria bacterium 4484_95]
MIKLTRLTKSFGSQIAVDDLSLDVEGGELFGFLGPNGAGKTTTIKMMAGILKPTSGKVEIAGFDVQRQPERAKMKIGYVPDDPYLYDRLTAREYLEFVGGLYRLDKKTVGIRSAELFEIFDMNGWVDRKCEEYSHGMRQKVVFCAAFLHDPTVLIVDEPVVGLDPRSTKMVKDFLKQYAAKGVAVFISTHVLSIAEELCDRVGIINKGKLIGVGSIAQLRDRATQRDANLESLFLELTCDST